MRHSATNLFIANLAGADLVIMVFGVPEIVQFVINRGWLLGLTLCRAQRFILVSSLYASIWTLMAVCIERSVSFRALSARVQLRLRTVASPGSEGHLSVVFETFVNPTPWITCTQVIASRADPGEFLGSAPRQSCTVERCVVVHLAGYTRRTDVCLCWSFHNGVANLVRERAAQNYMQHFSCTQNDAK